MDESELLSDNVSNLIDAVSNLVLCTITGEMGDIKNHCTSLAEYTQKVVLQAKNVAIASRNKETTIEITNCTNGITSTIEKLIEVFIGLVQNFKDTEAKKRFAEGAKEVGLAINELIIAADTAASRKVVEACENSITTQKTFLQTVNNSPEDLIEAARDYGQNVLTVISSVFSASKYSADSSKSSLLSHSVDQIKPAMSELVKAAQAVNQDFYDADKKNELATAYKSAHRIISDIIEAAQIIPDFSESINAAFDQFNKMLDLANAVKTATDSLFKGVLQGISAEDFAAQAKYALQTTMDLIQQAMKALENEKDPVRREQIERAIAETKAAISNFIKSSQAVLNDPDNKELKAQLVADKRHLDSSVKKLVALTSNGMEEEKLFYTAEDLRNLTDEFIEQAAQLGSEDLLYYADKISSLTERVVKDARAVAMKSNDAGQRQKIFDAISNLRKAGDRYTGDIRNLARNPGDPELLGRVHHTHDMFKVQIHKTLVASGIEKEMEKPRFIVDSSSDSDLVKAAKEQAKLALKMVEDAELMAQQITDPAKKQELLNAIALLRKYADDVIHFAQIAAADPDNLDKQIQLDEAQRLLADGMKNVIFLTSSVADELRNLMNAIVHEDDGSNNVFALADSLIAEISKFVDNIEHSSPKDVVLQAKELTNLTNQLAALIRKYAEQTPDAKIKDQLIQLSRFMRDRATQVKMIAAVKVASGGDAGQVSSAAVGLRSTLKESVSLLTTSELKRRREKTVARVEQLRQMFHLWQQSKSVDI